jgi:hypothetical protein
MISALLLAALAACSDGTAPNDASLASASSAVRTVSPSPATVVAGATVQLTALDGGGRPVSARWESSNVAVASVSETGLVTGVAAGSATVTARTGRYSAASSVTVTAAQTPAPVASVEVSPTTAGVDVGGAVQLTATLRDASGAVLTGRPVAWASADPAIATVDAGGMVRGVAAGSAAITASAEGRTGTAAVTVSAPASGPIAVECASARAEWIWCDDFEQDRLARYFEVSTANGSFGRAAGVGVNGSSGMRARWAAAGQVSAGNLKLAFGRTPSTYFRPVDAGTRDYREVYWRVYVRTGAGWTGGGYKFTRATVMAGSNWQQAMIAHLWTGGSTTFLTMDPASGTDAAGNLKTTSYNDFANLRWMGATPGKTPVFDGARAGRWQCVEAHVRLNDAGQSNGVFEFWVDGAAEARRADLNWVGSHSAYGINSILLENYWNDGAPQAQERFFDNFVVSTQRIGC